MIQQFDVLVLGAGFGGSLTALLLDRIGFKVALIDRGTHPRFSIGESSTPIADYVLESLSETYDLPQFQPFCKYGTWQKNYPDLACGIKRGFSYFDHSPGEFFQLKPDHGSELLVTANLDDQVADAHWFRSDVDQFFAKEVQKSKVVYLDETEVVFNRSKGWSIKGERRGEQIDFQATFLIDATGTVGVVPQYLGVECQTAFQTFSTAVYGHFENVIPWAEILDQKQIDWSDYPFDCDHAALHHVLRDGWMWQLRFNNEITSAGFVLDSDQSETLAEELWCQFLNRYPAIKLQFDRASVVSPDSGLYFTGRLQRGWKKCAGPDWALLPHTAGFIDPLHSTGIAHTLCGIERLVTTLERHWGKDELAHALTDYSESILAELEFIDDLVACCYRSLGNFDLFTVSTLFYFAAATSYENQRCNEHKKPLFLCADDHGLKQVTRAWLNQITNMRQESINGSTEIKQAIAAAETMLKPWNRVGLFSPEVPNMYYYTAAPKSEPQ